MRREDQEALYNALPEEVKPPDEAIVELSTAMLNQVMKVAEKYQINGLARCILVVRAAGDVHQESLDASLEMLQKMGTPANQGGPHG